MTFGENLKCVREKYCLTQLQMATRMQISRPYYNKLENDKVSISAVMLVYIAKVSNIPINVLINENIDAMGKSYNKKYLIKEV